MSGARAPPPPLAASAAVTRPAQLDRPGDVVELLQLLAQYSKSTGGTHAPAAAVSCAPLPIRLPLNVADDLSSSL